MKSNTVVAVKEILDLLNIDNWEIDLPKYSATIGGITGIVSPNKLISIPKSVTEIEVLIGNNSYVLELDGVSEEREYSDVAKQIRDNE